MSGPAAPALLIQGQRERGMAVLRFHAAVAGLSSVTAVPAAAAMPEPVDVAAVLGALAAGLQQLDPVLGHLEERLTALATSPNVHLADPGPARPSSVDSAAGPGGADACRVCGCTEDRACPDGCWWVPDPAGLGELCSSCAVALAGGPGAVLQAIYAVLAVARAGLAAAAGGAAAAGNYSACLQLADLDDQVPIAAPAGDGPAAGGTW